MTNYSDLPARLENDGFFHAQNVLDPVTIDTLFVRSVATLFRERATRQATKSSGSMCSLSGCPEYADIIASPAIFNLLRQAGATDARWVGGFLISKPGGGPPLFWHQDWWAWDDEASYGPRGHQLFVMVYLTETSRENGCLRVIPGSHRRDHPLHHLEAAHSDRLQSFQNPDDPAYADHPDEVSIAVKPGDLVVGDSRLIHGAYANRAAAERPLLTLWYMPNWSSMSAEIRAAVCQVEVPVGAERPLTPFEWPDALRARVIDVLPSDGGGAKPLRRNRTPDFARLAKCKETRLPSI